MPASFYFYDLETSGINPRSARVMQFAGQRTDMQLRLIGEPTNLLIKITPDVIPEPDAIFLTGITPQQTLADGITEVEFLKYFYSEIVTPDTIFVGFNNIRFDDEFMRFLNYRNFYDAYEWEWANGCGRWDMLDVIRMARALRPEGIAWPFTDDNKPTNRLELLTKLNDLDHANAHDALSDVTATIAVAKLLQTKQPELFKYLYDLRDKKKIAQLITSGEPFVYTSGHYSSNYLHTSAAVLLAEHPQQGTALIYDLRFDPTPFISMNSDQLIAAWQYSKDPNHVRLPVKTVKYNRNPVVAPLGVIKAEAVQERIGLTVEAIRTNLALLAKNHSQLARTVLDAVAIMDAAQSRDQAIEPHDALQVDARLYEGFVGPGDKKIMQSIRSASPESFDVLAEKLHDERLRLLLPLYKARNFPDTLTTSEREDWDAFCRQRIFEGKQNSLLVKYFARLQELATGTLTTEKEYLLEELQLYGQSIMPAELS
jgi:exodeoxyribonuclease-1